jgi:thiamine phosphate synthase YjbQ (UPF0047 family)
VARKLAPKEFDYHHHQTGKTMDFASWRTIMGIESVIAVTCGKLDFGTWKNFYANLTGQRNKNSGQGDWGIINIES